MKKLKTLLCACTFASLSIPQTHSELGLLKIFRGDDDVPKFQRVAFLGSAVVKETEGIAERLCGVERWEPLPQGAQLQPGELVRTRNGEIVLKMTESGSFVKMTPNTILRLVPAESGLAKVLSGTEAQSGFEVRSCRGPAFYREPAGEWKPVLVNTILAENSLIFTEPDTTVDLFSTTTGRPLRVIGGTRKLTLTEISSIDRSPQSELASVPR